MPRIQAPDGSLIDFPDNMSDGDITTAMGKLYPSPSSNPSPPVEPSMSWDYVKDATSRAGAGIGRGLGLPDKLPTSQKELQDLSDRMNTFDPSMLLGPGGPAIVGAVRNVIDAKNRINAGDVVGGGAQGITAGILPLLGIPEAGAEEAAGEAAGNTAKGMELNDIVPPHPSIKKLTEVLPVSKNAVPRFQDAAKTAIPALKEFETPDTPVTAKNWQSAEKLAEAKRNDAAESFIAPARSRGVQVDGGIVARKMMDAIPPAWKTDPNYAQQYQDAVARAQSYNHPMSIDDNINGIQYNNRRLVPFHQASKDKQLDLQAGGFPLGELEAEAQGRRDALAQAVDPEHQGAQFKQIRNEQNKLITFRQAAESGDNALQTQPTLTGGQKALGYVSDAAHALLGDPRQVALRKLQQAPGYEAAFNKAFRDYDGPTLPETPTAAPDKYLAIPPSRQLEPGAIRLPGPDATKVNVTTGKPLDLAIPPSRQLGPGAIRLPATDASKVNITTGKPLEQSFEVHLKSPEERAQFAHQRDWTEVLADPRTLAAEKADSNLGSMLGVAPTTPAPTFK